MPLRNIVMSLNLIIAAFVLGFSAAACPAASNESDATPAPMNPRYASSSDGARIAYYVTAGKSSVPVLVLSGGPGTDHRYMRVGGALDRLGSSRTLVYWDQRGTSNSAEAVSATIDQYIRDIDAVRAASGAERMDLLGHSFGGYLAMAYAIRHPQNVRSIVLVGSAMPRLGDEQQLLSDVYPERIAQWRSTRAKLAGKVPASSIDLFQRMEFVDQEVMQTFLTAVSGFTYNLDANNALRRDMQARNYWKEVSQLRMPVIILHGRQDAVIAPRSSWNLHRAISGSVFYVFEETGHLPHVEKPDEFQSVVEKFLVDVAKRR